MDTKSIGDDNEVISDLAADKYNLHKYMSNVQYTGTQAK